MSQVSIYKNLLQYLQIEYATSVISNCFYSMNKLEGMLLTK